MAGNLPEETVRAPVAFQSWRQVSFVHWRYDPGDLAPLLPRGLAPDVVDGSAWVGLTPFRVERSRLSALPPLPFTARYAETNLRTYVRDPSGRDGIWFLSLDVQSVPTVLAARVLAVRYFPARMHIADEATHVRYECRRVAGPPASHLIEVEPGTPAGVDDVVARLVGRWRAYTRRGGQLLSVAVEHPPWPVHEANLVRLEQDLTEAAGLRPPSEAPLVHYSPGVDVKLGAPRPA